MTVPETRASLLLRLHDRSDFDAWAEFSRLYRPVVCRLAVQHGMQSADAEDLAQQVLIAISNAIGQFDYSPGRAKFRTWLKTIARRAIINAMTRQKKDVAAGGSEVMQWLQVLPDPNEQTRVLDLQYRRQIFRVAADEVRQEVRPEMWEAFYLSAIEQRSAREISERLGCSEGSVYTSRSRVIRRLKTKVQELDLVDEGESQ
ncbi:sigma-70 family RNA polymerase sigma factor [Stieleria sp. JC731]|uniref:RNA polymerase sigma factor n=1 Tax=Pirellulaceae TaxID=2691357 RepID=UPI001E630FCB|nr:sigma-70 family RNA polymerase sigma factor [Stieleria sp. JC731]MCC9599552.1 sigma-70 family RNA polymerase sigma factor [Stieleria sp. JC731]